MEELFQIPKTDSHHEVLEEECEDSKKKKKRKILFSVLAFLLILFSVTLYGIGKFAAGVLSAEESFQSAQEDLLAFSFEEANEHIADAERALQETNKGILFFSWMKLLPFLGDHVEALSLTSDAALESISALQRAIDIVDDVYAVIEKATEDISFGLEEDVTLGSLDGDVRMEVLETLHNRADDFAQMKVELSLALKSLEELQELDLHSSVQELIDPFAELLPTLVDGVELFVPVAASVDELSGLYEDRQWLTLFLNDSEIRPGGGFIGVYGLLHMREGDLTSFTVDDSYAVDRLVVELEEYQVTPPEPLQTYVGVERWYFRDANWSPDIPTSSSDARTLFRQEFSAAGEPVPEVHGVINMTLSFAEDVFTVLGPITVDGIEFTGDNLRSVLQYDVEFGFVDRDIPWDERKHIIGDLADVALTRLYELPLTKWSEMMGIIVEGFRTKSLAVYSEDSDTQRVFADAGWDGALHQGSDDFFMLVDANMAALKTDPYVDRDITYAISEEDGEYIAKATINYVHSGAFTELVTRYRTYTRLYVPLGSKLIESSGALVNDRVLDPQQREGDVEVADDLGYTSFGAFTAIEPGSTGTLSFTYKLSESVKEAIDSGFYELWIEKQMGAASFTLTADFDFGKKIRAATPSEDSSLYGDALYENTILIDASTGVAVEF